MGFEVLIRCDGGGALGYGHLVRCLALARELAGVGLRPGFAVRREAAASMAGAAGFEVFRASATDSDQRAWLAGLMADNGCRVVVCDVRDDGLTLIQQNPGPTAPSRVAMALKHAGDRWEIDNARILGWLRKE